MSITKNPPEVIFNGDGTKTTIYYVKYPNGRYYKSKRTTPIARKPRTGKPHKPHKPHKKHKPHKPHKRTPHKPHKPHKKHKPHVMTKTRTDKGKSRLDPEIKARREEKRKIVKSSKTALLDAIKELAKNDNITAEQCQEYIDFMLSFNKNNFNKEQEKIKLASAIYD